MYIQKIKKQLFIYCFANFLNRYSKSVNLIIFNLLTFLSRCLIKYLLCSLYRFIWTDNGLYGINVPLKEHYRIGFANRKQLMADVIHHICWQTCRSLKSFGNLGHEKKVKNRLHILHDIDTKKREWKAHWAINSKREIK